MRSKRSPKCVCDQVHVGMAIYICTVLWDKKIFQLPIVHLMCNALNSTSAKAGHVYDLMFIIGDDNGGKIKSFCRKAKRNLVQPKAAHNF